MTTKALTAQQALLDAEKSHTESFEAIAAAEADVARAEQTLADAQAHAIEVVGSKCADATEARQRIEKAREAIKQAEDELDFEKLKLQAAQVVQRQAYDDMHVTQRRASADAYKAEHKRFNDPACRETVLLETVAAAVAELYLLLWDRKELHDRLNQEHWHLPADEKPAVPRDGRPIQGNSPRTHYLAPFGPIPPEVIEAVRAGNEAGQLNKAQRDRARQAG